MSVAITLAAIAIATPAQAWSEEGHLTVCEIAYRNLTANANSAVDDLLNSRSGGIRFPAKRSPTGSTAARYYIVLNLGCLEEDTRPRANSSQHFINVPRDTARITSATCPPRRPDDDDLTNCILNGISAQFAVLRDASKPQRDRVEALMGVGHWVGDIHQPLHISFADDTGGNEIKVRLGSAKCGTSGERPDKLHAVWDGCILQAGLFERVRQSPAYLRASERGRPWKPNSVIFAAAKELKAKTTLAEERQWIATEPWEWAQEAFAKTLDPRALYCVQVGEVCQYAADMPVLPPKPQGVKMNPKTKTVAISQGYLTEHGDFAEEQIRKAGHRLAHLINLALDPNYQGPVQN